MLSKSLFTLGALALSTLSSAKPLPSFKEFLAKRGHGKNHSFNDYSGFESMLHFDDFYGSDDFSGYHRNYNYDKDIVCHTENVVIVQQYLSVLREYYKKIITEQICEVEVQTVVHQQFVSGCEDFSHDIRRYGDSYYPVTYDHMVSCKISQIHDENNECVIKDWGWGGSIVGSHACSYSGDNWDEHVSPEHISSIYGLCQQSYGYSSPSYSSYWGSHDSSSYGSSYGSYNSYGSGYSPSYDYNHLAPPSSYGSSYGSGYSNSYGYGSSYSPSYGSSGSYGSSYSPSYGSSYGYGSPSYGSSSCSGYGCSSPDIIVSNSSVSGCDSCESSMPVESSCDGCDSSIPVDSIPISDNSTVSTDSSVPVSNSEGTEVPVGTDVSNSTVPLPGDDSVASGTAVSNSSVDASSALSTGSANLAATSVGTAGASIVNTGTAPPPAGASPPPA